MEPYSCGAISRLLNPDASSDNANHPTPSTATTAVSLVRTKQPKVPRRELTPNVPQADKKRNLDPRMPRTLFVGNVPVKSKRKELIALFSPFGEVESVRFRSVSFADTKLPRKAAFVTGAFHESRDTMNAYVVMSDADAARRGLGLNGTVFRERHLRVDLADGSEARDVSLSVFVGNLPFDTMEEELRAFFQCCGSIKSVRVVRDSATNIGKGFAFVQFEDAASMDGAIGLHQTQFKDRPIRVFKASKNAKANSSLPYVRRRKKDKGDKSFQGIKAAEKKTLKKSKRKQRRAAEAAADVPVAKRHKKKTTTTAKNEDAGDVTAKRKALKAKLKKKKSKESK